MIKLSTFVLINVAAVYKIQLQQKTRAHGRNMYLETMKRLAVKRRKKKYSC